MIIHKTTVLQQSNYLFSIHLTYCIYQLEVNGSQSESASVSMHAHTDGWTDQKHNSLHCHL